MTAQLTEMADEGKPGPVAQIPEGCRCSWSAHGRKLGEGLVYTFKYPSSACLVDNHNALNPLAQKLAR